MVVQSEEDYISMAKYKYIEVGVKKKLRMQLIYSNRDIFVKITKKIKEAFDVIYEMCY